MTAGVTSRNPSRSLAYAAREARYIALRNAGMLPNDIAAALGLSRSGRDGHEASYAVQTHLAAANGSDSSCPRFAEHDLHIRAVLTLADGFPKIPKLRTGALLIGRSGEPWRVSAP